MTMLWMPRAIIQPEVIEAYGMPEIYADGGIIRVGDGLAETILYRQYAAGGQVNRHGVLRVLMPRSGFDKSLTRAFMIANGGRRH